MKIGVVRIQDLVTQTAAGKHAEARLQEHWSRAKRALKDLQGRANAPRARGRPGQDNGELERELDRWRRDAEARIEALRQSILEEVLASLQPLVERAAHQSGLSIVLSAPHSALLYVAPDADLTAALIQQSDAADGELRQRLDRLIDAAEAAASGPAAKA